MFSLPPCTARTCVTTVGRMHVSATHASMLLGGWSTVVDLTDPHTGSQPPQQHTGIDTRNGMMDDVVEWQMLRPS